MRFETPTAGSVSRWKPTSTTRATRWRNCSRSRSTNWSGRSIAIPVTTFRHFRSDDLLYTFENDVPTGDGDPDEAAATWLLAYEATFRELGDVAGETDEDA